MSSAETFGCFETFWFFRYSSSDVFASGKEKLVLVKRVSDFRSEIVAKINGSHQITTVAKDWLDLGIIGKNDCNCQVRNKLLFPDFLKSKVVGYPSEPPWCLTLTEVNGVKVLSVLSSLSKCNIVREYVMSNELLFLV